MPWHESQLTGVAVGGLLVFLTSRFLERKGEKKRLTAGIKTEIMTQTRFLRVGLKQLENYLDQLETTGTLKQKFRFTGAFTTPFLDANLDKLTLLDTTLSGKLIAYRGVTGVLGNAIRITEEMSLAASQGSLPHDAVKKRIAIAANAWRKLLTLGDEIVELVR
jgi:hypothetical protein